MDNSETLFRRRAWRLLSVPTRALGSLTLCLALLVSPSSRAITIDDLPELGDTSSSLFSPEMERRIGRDFLKQIHAALPTVSDPVLKYYAERQLFDLTEHSQLKEKVLSVVLIDSPQLNAFAAPGGVVGINLGLFLYAEDVHEYSSVIAHELAHLSQRHFARGVDQQRASTIPNIIGLLAAIAIGAAAGGDAGLAAISATQAAAQSNALRYSRGREQEADRIGLSTLQQAGLDPDGMARMFERMQRAYRHSRKPPEFLLTHPLSDTRVSDARNQAADLNARTAARQFQDSPDFQLMRARVEVRYADTPQTAVTEFRQRLRQRPDDTAAAYGLALALSAANKHVEALDTFKRIFESAPGRILYAAAQAELLINARRYTEAEQLISHQLVLNPDNPPLATLYAKALNGHKRHADAEQVLERQTRLRPEDVDLWYELAETSGLAGNVLGVHKARAEYFALHGAYPKAIQHLEYARQLVSRSDSKTVAKLEARILTLRDALEEARRA